VAKESSAAKPKTIVISDAVAMDDSVNKALKQFTDEVNAKSNGSLKAQLFPAAQLGAEVDSLRKAQSGSIQITVNGVSSFDPLDAAYTPWAFESQAQMDAILSSGILNKFFQQYEKDRNLKMIGWLDRNPRNITSNTPVRTPADLKGLRIRLPQFNSELTVFKSLGSDVQSLAANEIFTALQTGTVQAQENPVDLIFTNKFYEVQKYLSVTQHSFAPFFVYINTSFWNGLTKEQQTTITTALANA